MKQQNEQIRTELQEEIRLLREQLERVKTDSNKLHSVHGEDKTRRDEVYWPVLGDVWLRPKGEVARYISKYRFGRCSYFSFHEWKLEFTCIRIGTFRFVAECGKSCSITATKLGDYSFRFNSPRPTISQVEFYR
ncbi:hypothetical protein DL96DRAFT_125158 [Flagelloscypha sp. PMI_526]|nr:hypothetical protein DL96DRAFT_125158 [Flagelloscypha sp. PMI_526]